MSDKKLKNKDLPSNSKKRDDDTQSDDSQDDGATGTVPNKMSIEAIRKFFAAKLHFHTKQDEINSCEKVIDDLSLDGLIKHWKDKGFKKIITMVGAGISTSAGIPDFRSPGSGLYDNLEKYNLPHPQAIFELDYFEDNPKPFFVLAKELYPGSFKPTPSHYFVKMLNDKGLLVRHYTQNIDTLERIAEIPDEKLVEAHGTFYTNHCRQCKKLFSMEWMKEQIFADIIPTCDKCNGVVKPDIVFFGQDLPLKFYECPLNDFDDCDLLLIMGTSLEVQPFASLVDKPNSNCIRFLINRDEVGKKSNNVFASWLLGSSLSYNMADNKRDIAFIGDCDDGVYALADGLGWGDELRDIVKKEHTKLDHKKEKNIRKSVSTDKN